MADPNNEETSYLDYEGLQTYKQNSDKLYLPIIKTGSLTGTATAEVLNIEDSRITETMVPYIQFTSDPSVVSGSVSVSVANGSITVSAVLNGTLNFIITLTEKQ